MRIIRAGGTLVKLLSACILALLPQEVAWADDSPRAGSGPSHGVERPSPGGDFRLIPWTVPPKGQALRPLGRKVRPRGRKVHDLGRTLHPVGRKAPPWDGSLAPWGGPSTPWGGPFPARGGSSTKVRIAFRWTLDNVHPATQNVAHARGSVAACCRQPAPPGGGLPAGWGREVLCLEAFLENLRGTGPPCPRPPRPANGVPAFRRLAMGEGGPALAWIPETGALRRLPRVRHGPSLPLRPHLFDSYACARETHPGTAGVPPALSVLRNALIENDTPGVR